LKTSQSLTALERDKGTSNYRAKVKRGAQFCEGSENTLKFICNFGVNLGDRIRWEKLLRELVQVNHNSVKLDHHALSVLHETTKTAW